MKKLLRFLLLAVFFSNLFWSKVEGHGRVKRQASSALERYVNLRLGQGATTQRPGEPGRPGGGGQRTPQKFDKDRPPGTAGSRFPRPPRSSRLTVQELRTIQTIIQGLITLDPELIPNWVQLSFHECFGPFGCNGCLDVRARENRGLAPTFVLAQFLRFIIAPSVTNADFVALLGTEAVKAGARRGGGSIRLPYSIGRRDCFFPLRDIGLPTGERLDTVELLKRQFRLSRREAVALMGAHSLGRARVENSGFNGSWDASETGLDTGYYRIISNNQLKAQKVNNRRATSTQWSDGFFLMLHADLILRKQFTTSGRFDEPSCGANDIRQCPDQPDTIRYINEFNGNQRVFLEAFAGAYLKMISKTSFRLTSLE